jgi:hypothetical protein
VLRQVVSALDAMAGIVGRAWDAFLVRAKARLVEKPGRRKELVGKAERFRHGPIPYEQGCVWPNGAQKSAYWD